MFQMNSGFRILIQSGWSKHIWYSIQHWYSPGCYFLVTCRSLWNMIIYYFYQTWRWSIVTGSDVCSDEFSPLDCLIFCWIFCLHFWTSDWIEYTTCLGKDARFLGLYQPAMCDPASVFWLRLEKLHLFHYQEQASFPVDTNMRFVLVCAATVLDFIA